MDAKLGDPRANASAVSPVLYYDLASILQEKCKKLPLVNDFGFPDSYFMQLET